MVLLYGVLTKHTHTHELCGRRRALRERRLLAESTGYGPSKGKGSGAFSRGGGKKDGRNNNRNDRQPDGIRFTAWWVMMMGDAPRGRLIDWLVDGD